VIPGQGQGAFGTADLTQSDFVKRMQAVKNTAAIKQVAGLLQKQWMQSSKTLPAAPASTPAPTPEPKSTSEPAPKPASTTPGYSSIKTNAPTGIPTIGKSNLPTPTQAAQPTKTAPATPTSTSTAAGTYNKKTGAATLGGKTMTALSDLPPHVQKKIGAVTEIFIKPITEAASLDQLTDWYVKSVVPKSLVGHKDEYLKNATIRTALQNILATADNPGEQEKAFADLVAATSVESQVITAKNPELAAATATGGSPAATKTLSGGASAAKTNIASAARISPAQIDEIAKLTGELGRVQAADSTTLAYLEALGFNIQ
jgi:hypothetical protein